MKQETLNAIDYIDSEFTEAELEIIMAIAEHMEKYEEIKKND